LRINSWWNCTGFHLQLAAEETTWVHRKSCTVTISTACFRVKRTGTIEGVPTEPKSAIFLSYASEDAAPAQRLCATLRAAGIEVWFDQSELRGGDAWDQKIRREIATDFIGRIRQLLRTNTARSVIQG
jgi:hypothetical protein